MDSQTTKTMFSSKSNEWGTPQAFYERLNEVHGFTLDPCADAKNKKCAKFYTMEDNGLAKSWEGEKVFMNPPYGRQIKHWIQKAYQEGQKPNTRVVCLVPARTDTKYWHDYCMKAETIHFVKGRLKFGDSKNAAPFPSAVVVFDGDKQTNAPHVTAMTNGGSVCLL